MSNWNEDHFFTKGQKIYMLFCGLIIVSCVVWVTHIAWKYDRVNAEWDRTFTTPSEFWIIKR